MPNLKRIAFIVGSGRSGSTLLELLLNRHPQTQSVGAVHRLNRHARKQDQPCSCGKLITECEFWLRVEEIYRHQNPGAPANPLTETEIQLHRSTVTWLGALIAKGLLLQPSRGVFQALFGVFCPKHAKALDQSLRWYEAIASADETPVLVDSSKDVRRGTALYFARPDLLRPIQIIRDGRAVTFSRMRRYKISMEEAAKTWVYINGTARAAVWSVPEADQFVLRYEELCDDPAAEMARVCDFLGIDFSDDVLSLDKASSHGIAGNPMRFDRSVSTIKKDEAWKDALSSADLATFERIAGGMNRRLGYA